MQQERAAETSSPSSQMAIAPTETVSITPAQVSLLRAGLLQALQPFDGLCSTMEGEFLQVNFWLTVFASCRPHNQLPTHFKGKQRATYPAQPPTGG